MHLIITMYGRVKKTLYTYATFYCVYTYMQVLAHTKATGTEEVLKRLEKELRQKLEEMKIENQSLSHKARSITHSTVA